MKKYFKHSVAAYAKKHKIKQHIVHNLITNNKIKAEKIGIRWIILEEGITEAELEKYRASVKNYYLTKKTGILEPSPFEKDYRLRFIIL